MKNIFYLAVAVGAILHGPGFQQTVLNEVPEDAQKHWENGEYWLGLKADQSDFLKQYSKTKLEQILKARKPLGYAVEIAQLEKAIADADKPEKAKPAELPEQDNKK